MGNDQNKNRPATSSKQPTAIEVKTYIMVIQNKLTLFRNKKINSIKQKKIGVNKVFKGKQFRRS